MSDQPASYLEIQLDQQPIELCKLLKIADLVAGGGEAKVVISEGYVLLNGEVECQKRKKIYHNDVVEFNGEVIQVVINESLAKETALQPAPPAPNLSQQAQAIDQSQVKQATKKNNKQKKAVPTPVDTASRSKRKPISF
ncbi:RNA-binding S4 domain-containing protein [Colwellia sp. KU-HH00111]|uniref:RNA-binding S4 domain-containing protein n=1 Tax=Colwellia sp. KU-HH00111 TaxID=3127652 RepID=UPI003107B3E5